MLHIDWIHKYRKYKTKYFELKQHMGGTNQSGGAQPFPDPISSTPPPPPNPSTPPSIEPPHAAPVDVVSISPEAKAEVDEKIKKIVSIPAMIGVEPTCGKISPSGLFILVGYNNGQFCIYRMSTGIMILTEPFQTKCRKINAIDWAEGGSMLFVVAGDIDESEQISTILCQIHYDGQKLTEKEISSIWDKEDLEEVTPDVKIDVEDVEKPIGDVKEPIEDVDDVEKPVEDVKIQEEDDTISLNTGEGITIVSVNLNTYSQSIEYIQWKKNIIIAGYNDDNIFKILLFRDDIENIPKNADDNDVEDVEDVEADVPYDVEEADVLDGDEAVVDNVAIDDDVQEDVDIADKNPPKNYGSLDNVGTNETELLHDFAKHELTVMGMGMSFNVDATKLAILANNEKADTYKIIMIDVSINNDGTATLSNDEYIINSVINPRQISISDHLFALGDGLEEIDITASSTDKTIPLAPTSIVLPEDLTAPIVFAYNPVTKNELLICSQDKLCIYDTTDKKCISSVKHNLIPTINAVDWHSSKERFFITITTNDICVWCMECESGIANRHIVCNTENICQDESDESIKSTESDDENINK